MNGAGELNIRGAANGSYVVVAQNFAPGTTAADIESVMYNVGGQMTECRLIASNPTVIAEMTFVEKKGAEDVIRVFNNKKVQPQTVMNLKPANFNYQADGRTLYVWMKGRGGSKGQAVNNRPAVANEPEAQDFADDTMELDQNAEAREVENRLREERRSRPDRTPREVFAPTAPRGGRDFGDDNYYRGSRAEPTYQDGRLGFDRDRNNRYGDGREEFRDEGRMRSDGMRRGGGQSWRR